MDPRRARRYDRIAIQLSDLIEGKSPDLIAAMATISAVLHAKMLHHSWTGFYFVASDDELHVGPYQGPVACQILRGQGVCLHCARTGKPVVVPDVEQFPGHIACDVRARSEVVVPVSGGDKAIAVLDIDSHEPAQFGEDDAIRLAKILTLLQPYV